MNSTNEKDSYVPKPSDSETVEPHVPSETMTEPGQPNFEFVEGIGNHTTRSHAMKSYWRQKKNERQRQEDSKFDQPALRPLLSSKPRGDDDHVHSQSQTTDEPPLDHQKCSSSVNNTQTTGLPDQLFNGLRFLFASALGQRTETNTYPIQAHHHQFFYHCE